MKCRKIIAVFIALLVSLIIICPAMAQNAVDLQVITNVVEGEKEAGVLVIANDNIKDAHLKLDGPDGSISRHSSAMKAGEKQLLSVQKSAGLKKYQGSLTVYFSDGEFGSMPLAFELNVLVGLKLEIPSAAFDLAGKKLLLKSSRPIKSVEYTVISETGETLDQGVKKVGVAVEKQEMEIAWAGKDGQVIRIDLKVTDKDGAYAKMLLSPWSVDVEHEEVIFPSGSASITAKESPKLDKAYLRIMEHVARYGKLIELNLYIVGYTDTVGEKEYNLKLSKKRAKSIARYMRKKGFNFNIYHQGFGEEVLAVPTPDETDQAANRHALYILGGDFKPTGKQIPRADWTLLK